MRHLEMRLLVVPVQLGVGQNHKMTLVSLVRLGNIGVLQILTVFLVHWVLIQLRVQVNVLNVQLGPSLPHHHNLAILVNLDRSQMELNVKTVKLVIIPQLELFLLVLSVPRVLVPKILVQANVNFALLEQHLQKVEVIAFHVLHALLHLFKDPQIVPTVLLVNHLILLVLVVNVVLVNMLHLLSLVFVMNVHKALPVIERVLLQIQSVLNMDIIVAVITLWYSIDVWFHPTVKE